MNEDQGIGAALVVDSLVGVVIYAWLLYAYAVAVLQIAAFVAVAAVLVILSWIGCTMATTLSPAPLEPEPMPTGRDASATSEEKTSKKITG